MGAKDVDYTDRMTPEEINALREYIQSGSGNKLLRMLANQEIAWQAESWTNEVSTDKQIQNINKVHGVYWVRNLISDLITVKRQKLDDSNEG